MLTLIPKKLNGKIKFWENDVFIADNIKLTKEEQKVFEEFRKNFLKSLKARFED